MGVDARAASEVTAFLGQEVEELRIRLVHLSVEVGPREQHGDLHHAVERAASGFEDSRNPRSDDGSLAIAFADCAVPRSSAASAFGTLAAPKPSKQTDTQMNCLTMGMPRILLK
jgi:hypothetical protein